MAAGALLAGIPLVGLLMTERQHSQQTAESLNYYEQLHEQYSYASFFVLTRDVPAGEELTADMIREQRVQSAEELLAAASFTKEDLLGKRLKVSLTKGAALSTDMVYEGSVADDERQVELREVYLPQMLRENEFVDIRITFPNGEDYLVVGHKRVYHMIRDDEGVVSALQMRFSEQEQLRYQAACVDTKMYEDTGLYAVRYTGEFQPAAQVYYPVNRAVFRLMQWDPNIEKLFVVAGEQERRTLLETELEPYLSEGSDQSEETADPAPSVAGGTDESKQPLTLYTGLPEES